MNAEPIGQNGRRLKTWKEIAAFFGCDERTVRRWEETYGLPVRRVPNSPRSAVFAYEGELRAWLNTERPQVEQPNLRHSNRDNLNIRSVLKAPLWSARWIIGFLAIIGAAAMLWYAFSVSGVKPHTPSAEAEKFYQAGLYGWQSRTPAGLTLAVDDFTQAIVRDPQYAEAYAGLAACYNLLREYTPMPDEYAFPRAKAAAERAVALNPSLAEAHAALAFVEFYWSRDVPASRREFKKALALAPGNATVHHWYATALMNTGEFEAALAEIDAARRIDTASTSILADKGLILFLDGRTEEAETLLRRLEQTEPGFSAPHLYLAMIGRARGEDAQFIREFSTYAASRQHPAERAIADAAARGFARGGHRRMLTEMLTAQRQAFGREQDSAYLLAITQMQLGLPDQAIHYLALSLRRHEPDAMLLKVEPLFRALRATPEFRRLIRQAGLEPSS